MGRESRMKKEKKKAIIEWVISILLVLFVVKDSLYLTHYHLSPVAAHEQSERTYYYGPSEVVEEIDLDEVRIFLGKYKDWFSANMVIQEKGFFWRAGSGVGGMEIKEDQDISHSWSGSRINEDWMLMRFYGIVTNPEIEQIELDVVEGYRSAEGNVPAEEIVTLIYPLQNHRMFLFHWNEIEHEYQMITLRGIDVKGEIVYQEKL
jgi:hypothetical protein